MYASNKLFDSYKPCTNGNIAMTNGLRNKVIEKCTVKMKIYS